MKDGFSSILEFLPTIQKNIFAIKETLLANLVMLAEIPAPTFKEARRVEFILNRFSEYHLQNCSTDEINNALGIIPGTEGDDNIILVAHTDTYFDEKVDHTITAQPECVFGPGVADNALGVATLVTLPKILETLDISLKSNLILMGSSRSLGRGNIEGLRFFLENTDLPLQAGVCVEGVKLGRISYSSIGMMRCELSYKVPEAYDWTRFGAVGAIVTINEIINRILEIPLPKRPRTSIVLGSIEGGKAFDTIATEAILRFEIRSESGEMVQRLSELIQDFAAEVSAHAGAEVTFNVYAQRWPGGIKFSHPLAANTRQIMKALNISPRISPSTSELSAFIDKGIPAITLGLTNPNETPELEDIETIEISPVFTGISQLIGVLLAIDRGYCHENK